jgi:hypothetical protein
MALFGHPSPPTRCPLSGVKRKSASARSTSEFDPGYVKTLMSDFHVEPDPVGVNRGRSSVVIS